MGEGMRIPMTCEHGVYKPSCHVCSPPDARAKLEAAIWALREACWCAGRANRTSRDGVADTEHAAILDAVEELCTRAAGDARKYTGDLASYRTPRQIARRLVRGKERDDE
jgi:hypothetical protein